MNIYRGIPIRFQRDEKKINEYHEKAKLNGLRLIGEKEKKGRNWLFLYKCIDCEHEMTKRPWYVDKGNVCNKCNPPEYINKSAVVYILELSTIRVFIKRKGFEHFKFSWLKVGVTTDLDRRIEGDYAYGWDENTVIEDLQQFHFGQAKQASEYEKYLHDKYKRQRLNPDQMKSFHTKNGHTECYDTIMKPLFEFDLSKKGMVNNYLEMNGCDYLNNIEQVDKDTILSTAFTYKPRCVAVKKSDIEIREGIEEIREGIEWRKNEHRH